ncbi:MAG: hypothetical protein IJU40_03555 [Desulfovibrionaceae bacterium]|nr:hypothetical protein [Desulfovibrionaceae bacterium]
MPGNIIDASTLKRLLPLLDEYHCQVEYYISDARYSCPANRESLVLSGIELMLGLNPNFNIY